jgi:hypothetical protein
VLRAENFRTNWNNAYNALLQLWDHSFTSHFSRQKERERERKKQKRSPHPRPAPKNVITNKDLCSFDLLTSMILSPAFPHHHTLPPFSVKPNSNKGNLASEQFSFLWFLWLCNFAILMPVSLSKQDYESLFLSSCSLLGDQKPWIASVLGSVACKRYTPGRLITRLSQLYSYVASNIWEPYPCICNNWRKILYNFFYPTQKLD